MAKSQTPEPVNLTVIRLGKSFSYSLATEMDWAVVFDAILEIKSVKPAGKFYWPLDSMTFWKVEPVTSMSPHT
jgi:hypothetical protein